NGRWLPSAPPHLLQLPADLGWDDRHRLRFTRQAADEDEPPPLQAHGYSGGLVSLPVAPVVLRRAEAILQGLVRGDAALGVQPKEGFLFFGLKQLPHPRQAAPQGKGGGLRELGFA